MLPLADLDFMRAALAQARDAGLAGEVPVGAVIVKQGQIIAVGRNASIESHDPTAHAEIRALRAAALALGNYRLDDCELFVTLEPCAMCAGAILHARLKRIVFGAKDSKTGAAGSVIDLFSNSQINHQTQVQGELLAAQSAGLLKDFFQSKRVTARQKGAPIRDDSLRTPSASFAWLSDYPWLPNYVSDLPSLGGLRMHYLDEGPIDAAMTYLCLHEAPYWSYQYRELIPKFSALKSRTVVPDLIGFGKSDKPKKSQFHRIDWHLNVLVEFIERLDLNRIVLVIQGKSIFLGMNLLPMLPHRFQGVLVIDALSANSEDAAYSAPFPDQGHRAAVRAFTAIATSNYGVPDQGLSMESQGFWRHHWTGQTLIVGRGGAPESRNVSYLKSLFNAAEKKHALMVIDPVAQNRAQCIATTAINYFNSIT